jgi:hypothetical protein
MRPILRLWPFAREFNEDFVEHRKTAPAHRAIVDGRVLTVILGRISPAQLLRITNITLRSPCDDQRAEPSATKEFND